MPAPLTTEPSLDLLEKPPDKVILLVIGTWGLNRQDSSGAALKAGDSVASLFGSG
ncbi:hypothetical protein SAMN05660443_2319 [Marinospirillum celere]|uniref:Uncharacterized protein n=1 Tax=Marinospirillum celere TaxID=1122252 RepID=A0A1I1IJD6_9GAMM|nr:hypothetical protein SAMN05660443_2319 [Marinospirillum celere]